MQAIKGYFLTFEDDETEALLEALKDLDYTPDAEGIKECLLDYLLSPEVQREPPNTVFADAARQFLNDNPGILLSGMGAATKLFNKFMKGKS